MHKVDLFRNYGLCPSEMDFSASSYTYLGAAVEPIDIDEDSR